MSSSIVVQKSHLDNNNNNNNSTDQQNAQSSGKNVEQGEQKPLKICCACPETKRWRDECVVMNGEEFCAKQIEAHKECLRKAGFQI